MYQCVNTNFQLYTFQEQSFENVTMKLHPIKISYDYEQSYNSSNQNFTLKEIVKMKYLNK